MSYHNYYAKLNSSQRLSSPNSSLFLSIFKFPSPNNRFPPLTNSILLPTGILWNLVSCFLLFWLCFTCTVQQKQPVILFPWFHRKAVVFFSCSFIPVLLIWHPMTCGFSSTHTTFSKKPTCLMATKVAKMFYMGSERGKKVLCLGVCDMQCSLKSGALQNTHLP